MAPARSNATTATIQNAGEGRQLRLMRTPPAREREVGVREAMRPRPRSRMRPRAASWSSCEFLLRHGAMPAPMEQAEHGGNEDQSGDGGAEEAADDRAAERRVLLAAVAQAEGHGNHADDHGQRRHEHGSEARYSRLDGGLARVAVLGQALL